MTGSGGFAGFDASNIYNLAGKHQSGYGTPFDLDELSSEPLVVDNTIDLDNIQYLRLVDIPGNGDFLDSQGNPILDNWPTGGSGGFDFRLPEGQGVGALNSVSAIPEPATGSLLGFGCLAGLALLRRRRFA